MLENKKDLQEKSEKASQKSKASLRERPTFMLIIALLICFICAWGASLVKSGGGSITVKHLHWETPSGLMQNAQLFIPPNATKETKAPAIVVCHGRAVANEMQEANFVELSRRGYVVLAIDLYSHGDSDNLPITSWYGEENDDVGAYDGVKLLASLPYVDDTQIGITGHSNGAYASNIAVLRDNQAEKQLISSVLLICNDAFYTETKYADSYYDETDTNYVNSYGNRDVGIIAVKYDEIFHRTQLEDGTITSPKDFIKQQTAQSFLNFGTDPTGLQMRDSYTMYTETIDGKDATRVIYDPIGIHSWTTISTKAVNATIGYFQETLPAPNTLEPTNQIWQWKVTFSAIGMIGFFMFLIYSIKWMLHTNFFGVLEAKEPVLPVEATRRGKIWMWAGLSISALFTAISYPVIFAVGFVFHPAFFNQQNPWVLGLWSLCCGLFMLLILFLNYHRYAKAHGLSLRESGIVLSKEKLGKSILLGVLAAVSTYFIVFVTQYFFQTDFRLWSILAFRAFDAAKFSEILKFLPFFLFFYVVNSIAMNVFNFIQIGKREWVNTLIMAIFNTLGTVLLLVVMYSYFLSNGLMVLDSVGWGVSSMILWVYPMVIFIPIATVVSRRIYKATRNPYVGSIALSIIITTMACTTTLTYLIR